MCGRFALLLPTEAMAGLFDAVPGNDLPDVPNYNVCPTNPVPIIRSLEGARHLSSARWGFIPHWYKSPTDGPLLINARSETIAEKPAFGHAARERRCLIPMAGFYEWTKGEGGMRLPWYIQQADTSTMVLAGIWQKWGPDILPTCAIVTTGAGPQMATLHNRVPVVLAPEDWGLWLGEKGKGAARLMVAPVDGALQFHRVSQDVNSNRASGPDLIEPL